MRDNPMCIANSGESCQHPSMESQCWQPKMELGPRKVANTKQEVAQCLRKEQTGPRDRSRNGVNRVV